MKWVFERGEEVEVVVEGEWGRREKRYKSNVYLAVFWLYFFENIDGCPIDPNSHPLSYLKFSVDLDKIWLVQIFHARISKHDNSE